MATMTTLQVEPFFELEDFMNFSKESRLDSATLEKLAIKWEEWSKLLQAVCITEGKDSWLAVWLPEEVANAIDGAWSQLPSQGFMLNNLAQYLIMTAVGVLLPQTDMLGCAPTPKSAPVLRESLQKLGLASEDGALINRYAVVTFYPFIGGCEVCAFSGNCPKLTSTDGFTDIVLPGYEK